ncbi:hypothetical protein OH807_40955 [Kitasatospora sp. NBC_01560]|uniref:hypothetical protein n=1 Tax=Kitasatospora sp. NBC_01560 TaxID=2975965 RepID=UPI00386F059C
MKFLRRGLAVLAAVLTLAIAAFVINVIHQRSTLEDRRKTATADAEAGAHLYAAKLVPAFNAGPQTVRSLEELEHGTPVTFVSAAREGTSVVVGINSTATYPGSSTASRVDACLRVVLSRADGSITDRVDSIPCAQIHPATDRDAALGVG